LVLHDWGGPFGVRYAIDNNPNVKAIVAIETFLWNLGWNDFPPKVKMPFKLMRSPVGFLLIQVMNGFLKQFVPQNIHNKAKLTPEVLDGYNSPFPTIGSRKGIRDFPSMIPVDGKPEESVAFFKVLEERIGELKQPFLFILADPGMGGYDNSKIDFLKNKISRFEFKQLGPAGHYLQEDIPELLTEELVKWLSNNVP
jgi:haloalkane dehalogenase